MKLRWNVRISFSKFLEMVLDPPSTAAAELFEVAEPIGPQRLDFLLAFLSAHLDLDRPVGESVTKLADQRDGDRCERLEGSRFEIVSGNPQHFPSASVTAVQNSAQFMLVAEEGVGLINQQRRLILIDAAEDHRGSDVRSHQSP